MHDDANIGLQGVLEEQFEVGQGIGPQDSTQEIEARYFL